MAGLGVQSCQLGGIALNIRTSFPARHSRGVRVQCAASQGVASFSSGTGCAGFRSPRKIAAVAVYESQDGPGALPGMPAKQHSGLASFSGGVGLATFSGSRAEPKQSAEAEGWQAKLRSYGLAGVVAYGLLNTLYYSCVFLVVWSSFKVPRGLGVGAAARKAVEAFGVTWAGSQLTKAARAAGAVLLAPFVDRGLILVQHTFRLRSKRGAFLLVLAGCLSLAAGLFTSIVVVHA